MPAAANVLFVNLPTIPFAEIVASLKHRQQIPQRIAMPMGLMSISAYLKAHARIGRVAMVDYILHMKEIHHYPSLERYLIDVATASVDFIPDVIAFSLIFSTSHRIFIETLRQLKALWPDAITVVGGTHATAVTRHLLNGTSVDFILRGEGEIGFTEFVNRMQAGLPLTQPGLYSLSSSGVSFLEVAPMPEELDELPFPDWDLVDLEAYAVQIGSQRDFGDGPRKKVATIVTTRGCPGRCTFCAAHLVHGRKVRYRSVDNVMQEVSMLYERFGITLFIPEDDMFTVPKSRFLDLMRAFRELKIPGFELQNQDGLAVNTLDREVLDAMLGSGVRLFNLAVESGSPYVQRHTIRKHVELKRVKDLVEYLRDRGAVVRCYFILGFFGETRLQMEETLAFARSIRADWCLFSIATPLAGTAMHAQMLQAGYIQDGPDLWENAFFGRRGFDTPEITAADLEELAYSANLEINFVGNPNFMDGNFEKALGLYSDVVRVYSFHVVAWYCIMKCHQALGFHQEAKRVQDRLCRLVADDDRAARMYKRYCSLMPDFEMEFAHVD
jgi:radical SAM superfamily enzyme YgiQ (UPF0313 family)